MAYFSQQSLHESIAPIQAALVRFQSDTRLYDIEFSQFAHTEGEASCDAANFTVEAFWFWEALSELSEMRVLLLSPREGWSLASLLGCCARLKITLADGQRCTHSGLVRQFKRLDSEGGLVRYQVSIVPWLWLTTQHSRHRVFQDKSTLDILTQVWAHYAPQARWVVSDEVRAFLQHSPSVSGFAGTRPYTVQYRQTDFDFIQQLLAEEGLVWVIEEDDTAQHGHRLRLLGDTPAAALNSASPIRFHRASSQETSDAIQALGGQRQHQHAITSVLSYADSSKRSVAASLPTHQVIGGAHAPVLEDYCYTGAQTFTRQSGAQRYAELQRQATEARNKIFFGRSTVRSARVGTRFDLTQSTLDTFDDFGHNETERRFLWTKLQAMGQNNLPKAVHQFLSARFGTVLDALTNGFEPIGADPAAIWPQVQISGYANTFEALRSHIPWRPVHIPPPPAPGLMTAQDVGPEGHTQPEGADEIWCDAWGRVKVRFHWQSGVEADDRDTCWIPVLQRQAGPGYGWQFLPRIGHEVLINFLGGDLRRPLVLGSLYNGRGEAGVPPTHAVDAQVPEAIDTAVLTQASDHRAAGQGNLTGGHSPAWHGAGFFSLQG
jgi:type VI secretion system VgrG family protein